MFIVFEGIDGSGKTTISQKIAGSLMPCQWMREPTEGTPTRAAVDRAIMEGKTQDQIKAFHEDRELNQQLVNKLLKTNFIVVLDRYYYTTAAYQGRENLGIMQKILAQSQEAFRAPDLVVFCECSPETAMERIGQRDKKPTYFENIVTLTEIRQAYHKAFVVAPPKRLLVLDTDSTPVRDCCFQIGEMIHEIMLEQATAAYAKK